MEKCVVVVREDEAGDKRIVAMWWEAEEGR